MKSLVWVVLMCVIPQAFSGCDLHDFRWSCDLPAAKTPTVKKVFTVYCNNLPVYVDEATYLEALRYQHANINLDLFVEGDYVAGPCIPGSVASIRALSFERETPMGQRYIPAGLYK